MIETIPQFFRFGMKRELPELRAAPQEHLGLELNLGAGNAPILGAVSLDWPGWVAERDWLHAFEDETVQVVYAFHFLEHLAGADAIRMLLEVERVLVPGGLCNIIVPHRLSSMAYHDLDHKSFYTEDTFRTLFSTPYYEKNRERPWQLHIGLNVIIGVAERNLALMTQLYKDEP